MSTQYSLSADFVSLWASEVHLQFQQETSLIRDAVRTVTGITGHSYNFPMLGAGTATVNKNPNTPLQPMAETLSTATATMSAITAYRLIDSIEEVQTNADIRMAYTDSVVASVSRALDTLIITQLDTGTDETSNLVTANVLDAGGLAEMSELLSLNNVPLDGMRRGVVSVGAMKDILNDSKMVNELYVNKGAMEEGVAQHVLGFDLIMSNLTTVPSAGKHNSYFFHKQAVGLAIAQDIEVRVDYRPDLDSWGVLAKLVAGACVIDPNGLIKAQISD